MNVRPTQREQNCPCLVSFPRGDSDQCCERFCLILIGDERRLAAVEETNPIGCSGESFLQLSGKGEGPVVVPQRETPPRGTQREHVLL